MSYHIKIELDDQGRLVLPIPLAQQLGLVQGTT
jgi:bifunctional DNA-binding transcriptional regulator/antitoxin component of YhaV-PrlF toxin-antitoxin module